MSETLVRIVDLVRTGEVRVSAHGYDEIAEDGILPVRRSMVSRPRS